MWGGDHIRSGVPIGRSPLFILGAITVVALIVRLAPLRHSGTSWAMQPDSVKYIALANGLTAGCGFAQWAGRCGRAELERTPGYPLFLAASRSLRSSIVAQALLGAGTCLMVGLYAWWRWGMIVGALSSLTPVSRCTFHRDRQLAGFGSTVHDPFERSDCAVAHRSIRAGWGTRDLLPDLFCRRLCFGRGHDGSTHRRDAVPGDTAVVAARL